MSSTVDISKLEVYLVGGAVRDGLLSRECGDRDWVVVGGSVEEMLALGFTQVGRDFPVFLHPDNGEEYALARIERKQGVGHTGFVVHAAADVTLEDDLKRRDLTINAIAQRPDGELIDPFGGASDIKAQVLRHVSQAFSEDPLRILRVARLAAELPGFTVAPETNALMSSMCAADALRELSAERVWKELGKALAGPAPSRFFEVLESCGGYQPWFAELAGRQWQFSNSDAYHRLCELPLDEAELDAFCARAKVPKQFSDHAHDWLRWGGRLSDAGSVSSAELVAALEALRALHDARRLTFVLEHVRSHSHRDHRWLLDLLGGLAGVKPPEDVVPGPAYGEALREARIEWLEAARAANQSVR